MNKKPTGFIFYRGLSELDGRPIVGVIIVGKSANSKTGSMLQSYILADNGLSPVESAKIGADVSICGNCPHRRYHSGGVAGHLGSCYVNLGQGARAVMDGVIRGIYPHLTMVDREKYIDGRKVRVGSYGDPTAIPIRAWMDLLANVTESTGYTHQWKNPRFDLFADFCMASVDNEEDAKLAWSKAWRTFRVKADNQPKLSGEFVCPASAEAGHKVQCEDCLQCNGMTGKRSPVINAHGSLKKYFALEVVA